MINYSNKFLKKMVSKYSCYRTAGEHKQKKIDGLAPKNTIVTLTSSLDQIRVKKNLSYWSLEPNGCIKGPVLGHGLERGWNCDVSGG